MKKTLAVLFIVSSFCIGIASEHEIPKGLTIETLVGSSWLLFLIGISLLIQSKNGKSSNFS